MRIDVGEEEGPSLNDQPLSLSLLPLILSPPFSDLDAMAAEADAELAARQALEDEELKLVLAPGEAKYRTLEEMSRDIKDLDEASVEEVWMRCGAGCE